MILKKGHLYKLEFALFEDYYILLSSTDDLDTENLETSILCFITVEMPSLILDIGTIMSSNNHESFFWSYPSISDVFQVARLLKNSKYKYDFKTNKIVHKT